MRIVRQAALGSRPNGGEALVARREGRKLVSQNRADATAITMAAQLVATLPNNQTARLEGILVLRRLDIGCSLDHNRITAWA